CDRHLAPHTNAPGLEPKSESRRGNARLPPRSSALVTRSAAWGANLILIEPTIEVQPFENELDAGRDALRRASHAQLIERLAHAVHVRQLVDVVHRRAVVANFDRQAVV